VAGAWFAVAREKPAVHEGWYLRAWAVCTRIKP
jgi:hypothetical protein